VPDYPPLPIIEAGNGKLSVQCPKCSGLFSVPRKGNPSNSMTHFKGCVDTMGTMRFAGTDPVLLHLARLVIAETPVASRSASPATTRDQHHTPTTPRSNADVQSAFFRTTEALNESKELVSGCPGFLIRLDCAPARYLYTRHQDTDMGWFPVSFQPNGREVLVRSSECHRASPASQACLECTKVCNSSQLQEFLDHVLDAPENTPHEYLLFEQLLGVVNRLKQESTTSFITHGSSMLWMETCQTSLLQSGRIHISQ
jgi:hypothetical protein